MGYQISMVSFYTYFALVKMIAQRESGLLTAVELVLIYNEERREPDLQCPMCVSHIQGTIHQLLLMDVMVCVLTISILNC